MVTPNETLYDAYVPFEAEFCTLWVHQELLPESLSAIVLEPAAVGSDLPDREITVSLAYQEVPLE